MPRHLAGRGASLGHQGDRQPQDDQPAGQTDEGGAQRADPIPRRFGKIACTGGQPVPKHRGVHPVRFGQFSQLLGARGIAHTGKTMLHRARAYDRQNLLRFLTGRAQPYAS